MAGRSRRGSTPPSEDRTAATRRRGLPTVTDERQTLGEYLEVWLRSARSRLHLMPRLGRLRLTELQPQHIRDLLDTHLNAGRSPRSVQYTHAVLRGALAQALRDGLVLRNVAALVEPPRVAHDEVRPFTPAEARTFLRAVDGDRLQALYTVAIALGLRQGEALGLRWQDIDLETRTLSVSHTLQRVPTMFRDERDAGRGTRYLLAEPKTARSRRTVHLPDVVASALREHRRRQLEERLLAGTRWHDEWQLVFCTTIGTPLDARNVTHRFQALVEQAGLPRLRFHDLRHSAATLMLAQGVEPRTIMETLGHSQIGITMNLYAHVLPALQRDAADRMDALLSVAE